MWIYKQKEFIGKKRTSCGVPVEKITLSRILSTTYQQLGDNLNKYVKNYNFY